MPAPWSRDKPWVSLTRWFWSPAQTRGRRVFLCRVQLCFGHDWVQSHPPPISGSSSGSTEGLRVACEGQGPRPLGHAGRQGPPGLRGPAPGRKEASAVELPESRTLAGELPGLRRVAHVAGRAPRPIRNTVQDLKKVTPGYPVFLGKQGQLCHQTRGAPVLGDGATARRGRLCCQGRHVSRGPQGRRPAWTVGGSLNLVPRGLCPRLIANVDSSAAEPHSGPHPPRRPVAPWIEGSCSHAALAGLHRCRASGPGKAHSTGLLRPGGDLGLQAPGNGAVNVA